MPLKMFSFRKSNERFRNAIINNIILLPPFPLLGGRIIFFAFSFLLKEQHRSFAWQNKLCGAFIKVSPERG